MDATDRLRIDDCREELAGLLLEEVGLLCSDDHMNAHMYPFELSTYSLTAFDGFESTYIPEQDGCRWLHDGKRDTRGEHFSSSSLASRKQHADYVYVGSSIRCYQNAQLGDFPMQRHDRKEFTRGPKLGGPRCEGQTFLVLMYMQDTCTYRVQSAHMQMRVHATIR